MSTTGPSGTSPVPLLILLVFGGYLAFAYLRGFLGAAWKDLKPWLQHRLRKRP